MKKRKPNINNADDASLEEMDISKTYRLDLDELKIVEKIKKKPLKKGIPADNKISKSLNWLNDVFKSKKFSAYLIVFTLIILLFLGTWVRIQPIFLNVLDRSAEQATEISIRNQITQQVIEDNPRLRGSALKNEIERVIIGAKNENKDRILQSKKDLTRAYKEEFEADKNFLPLINKGDLYLPDIDTYFWLRYAYNIDTKGTYYDELRNGKPIDNHMDAPIGTGADNNLHSKVIVLVKGLGSVFVPGEISLVKAEYFVPVIFGVLGIIPAFFLGRKLTQNNIGGGISAFFYMVHPFALSRSAAGLGDTDIYTVFFPITIAWLFIEALNSEKIKQTYIWGSLTGLSFALYALFWDNWWFTMDIIIGSMIVYLGTMFIIHFYKTKIKKTQEKIFDEKLKNVLILFGTILLSSAIFITLISDSSFVDFIKQPLAKQGIQSATTVDLWPNVLTTVAELTVPSINTITRNIGGIFLFSLSSIGILFLILFERKENYKYVIFISLWYIAGLYASTKGVRFVLLIVPAFVMGLAVFFGISYKNIINLVKKIPYYNLESVVKIILSMIIVILLVPYYASAIERTSSVTPFVSDGWWNSLVKIREETSKDAIITSWWDYGHLFKVVADRKVTFDGSSQTGRPAHTVGKILTTSDEEFAIGLLRMYDCGHSYAYYFLENKTKSIEKTIDISEKIVVMNKFDAKSYLIDNENFSETEADDLLKLTHCEPPEAILITSEDMVNKASVWTHFGLWNFTRARLWKEFNSKDENSFLEFAQDYLDISKIKADSIYDEIRNLEDEDSANKWIGPFGGYLSVVGCNRLINSDQNVTNQSRKLIYCNGITLDLDEKDFVDKVRGDVYSLVYVEDNKLKEKIVNENGIVSVDILPDGKKIIIMDKNLARGLFTNLFFYGGIGLEHFSKFNDVTDVQNSRIIIWKIQWNKI